MDYESKIKKFVASFDVDPQNGFTPKCPNELPVPDGDKIVEELLENHRMATVHVASKDWHHPESIHIATEEHPQFSLVEGDYPNMDIHWNKHCIAGTYGSEFLDGLSSPSFYDFIAYKGLEIDSHPYSPCYHDLAKQKTTGVIEYLKSKDIRYVVVGGLAIDYCVKEACLDLVSNGFHVFLNFMSCRGIDKVTVRDAITEMKEAGVVICIDSGEIEEQIEGRYAECFYPQDI
jgi:nicotinamidase/pyrazinamidase